MIGAGRVAGGRANTAILLVDKVVNAQRFRAAVAPFVADALMETFGKGFGEAIGEGLGHDGVVVVVRGTEAIAKLFEADAAGYGECADVIGQAGFLGRDKVRERAARLASLPVRLLTKKVKTRERLAARFVRVKFDIVADGVGGIEAVDAARRDEFFCNDAV